MAQRDDNMLETMIASLAIAKYSSIVVLSSVEKWKNLALFTLRQNVYTDPQVPTAAAKKSTSTRSVDVSSSTEGGTDGATGVGGDAVLSPTNANDGANNTCTSSFWENGLDPNGSPTTEMAMAGPTKSTTTETRDEVVVGHPVDTATPADVRMS